MQILAVSDKVVPLVFSPQIKHHYGDVDLVVGCGDLPYNYLEYIVTMLRAPVLYVHGNHDKELITANGQVIDRPRGAILVDGRVERVGDLLVAGLGGSIRYLPRARYQYTEGEMWRRIAGLVPRLLWNKLRYGRYLDLLITHSPPRGIHDGDDNAHRGFASFLTFMNIFKPRYLLHGHKHVYRQGVTWHTVYGETIVVNVYPQRVIRWERSDHE